MLAAHAAKGIWRLADYPIGDSLVSVRNEDEILLVQSLKSVSWVAKSLGYPSAEDALTASNVMMTSLSMPSASAQLHKHELKNYTDAQIKAKLQEKLLEGVELKDKMEQNYARYQALRERIEARKEMAAQLETTKEERKRSEDRVKGLREEALSRLKAGKRAREDREDGAEEKVNKQKTG